MIDADAANGQHAVPVYMLPKCQRLVNTPALNRACTEPSQPKVADMSLVTYSCCHPINPLGFDPVDFTVQTSGCTDDSSERSFKQAAPPLMIS
mmetsp:Transcript_45706/g.75643  ORF Transcript_45706/g.75643 Transcript_45706/m.75643 type:complete len:93 (-) Transcript_45706:855-1133(-)